MPAGHDDDDVTGLDGRGRPLEIGGRDDFPPSWAYRLRRRCRRGDRRECGQVATLLDEVQGSVHMGACVHDGDDVLSHHAVLRVLDATAFSRQDHPDTKVLRGPTRGSARPAAALNRGL